MLNEKILSRSEELQKECHEFVRELINRIETCTVQDATNVWLFKKIAELENSIEQLKNK